MTRCFGRILRDSRHTDVQVVTVADVRDRLFPQWSMHRIHTSEVRRDILRTGLVDGIFQPDRLSQDKIES